MRKRIFILILSFAGILGGLNLPGQSIIKQDGRFGIADDKGNVIAKPEFDSIWPLRKYTNTFFIIKKKNKLAYCYRYELDSIYWLNESRRFWVTSRFDFDELQTMVVGLPGYSGSYSYTQIAYKQNGLWGIMYVQTKTGSGDGIFPSAGFYIAGFGALRIREAKYDSIFRIDRDAIYTTRLNGKYGFWEPTTNEVYEPEFDSIPLTIYSYKNHGDLPRNRYVSKNGKWGLVYFNKEKKSLEYKVPCMCNGLGRVRFSTYFCMGQNDTLQFYNAIIRQNYIPLIDGKPLQTVFYWNPHDTPPIH